MISDARQEVADEAGRFYADLNGYIRWNYQWGERGTALEHFSGPEYWVEDLADEISNHVAKNGFNGRDPVEPIYVAIASGNGAAKSAFAGMVNSWIMVTRPMSRVTVTANTGAQLRTKTWPQIDKWMRLGIAADWFRIQAEKIVHREFGDEWSTYAHTWNIGNTQASAGQHSREGSSVYIVDEASHVPEAIFAQFDGGLTDGEPFMIFLGNCTNRAGRLFRGVFGDLRSSYIHRSIDTRKCRYTNKALIGKWIEERGIGSDWVKAHILGEAPSADDLQLISSDVVMAARNRAIPEQDKNTPLVMGIDFARGGAANNVITWRRGRDMRSIPRRLVPGSMTRDTTVMTTLIINEIEAKNPDFVCGDAGNMGGPILDRVRQLKPGLPVIDVMFGSASPDPRYGNMRAYIWFEMANWLPGAAIEDSADLETDLTGPGTYQSGQEGKTFLESKDDMESRGLASPDWGDSAATTFAAPRSMTTRQAMAHRPVVQRVVARPKSGQRGWMRR